MGFVKVLALTAVLLAASCAARPEQYVATAQVQGTTITAQCEAAHAGVVQLKPHVLPSGAALREYVQELLAKLVTASRAHETTLDMLRQHVQQLRAEKDWYANHWWWRVWRFIRGSVGLLVGILVIGVIARIVGVAAVGTAIGTAAKWLWKTVAAALTVGVSAVIDVIEWCVLWCVEMFRGRRNKSSTRKYSARRA